jgi:hypothetical protein
MTHDSQDNAPLFMLPVRCQTVYVNIEIHTSRTYVGIKEHFLKFI